MTLSPTQRRHLYTGLVHFEKQLLEMEGLLASNSSSALFPLHRNDIAAAQVQALTAGIAELRRLIVAVMSEQRLLADPPALGVQQALRTLLTYAEIAAEEMGPSDMRGFGPLEPDQAAEVEALSGRLRAATGRLLQEFDRAAGVIAAPAPSAATAQAPAEVQQILTVGQRLRQQSGDLAARLLAGTANSLAELLRRQPLIANEEIRLYAAEAINHALTELLAEMFAPQALPQPPHGPARPSIECGHWRLRRPSFSLSGSGSTRRRFLEQMQPHAGEVGAALQTYARLLEKSVSARY